MKRSSLALLAAGALLAVWPPYSPAYITNTPGTFGLLCSIPPHISEARIEKVSQEKGVIIWRKVRDLKGKYPLDVIKHSIGKSHWPQHNPEMQQEIMKRAVVGKTAIFFHGYTNGHGNDINVYLDDGYWYAVAGHGEPDWCYLYSDQPALLRLYCGSKERLAAAVRDVVAGKEVVVPCLVDGKMEELRRHATKVQQLRASLKIQDYNPKRDFVRWGAPVDHQALLGMPGFTHRAAIPRVDPEAQAISCISSRGDGKPDLCLIGAGKVVLLRHDGGVVHETSLPGVAGCRAAVWADYNGDGRPDLFLATPTGPRLFTNPGDGTFKDDTGLLPKEACGNLTAAAWLDYDGDGRPDLLFCNGFHGLRLYRNKGLASASAFKPGDLDLPQHAGFEDVSEKVGLGPDGIAGHLKGDTLTVCDVTGDGRPDFLYGAGSGVLVLNTPQGFIEAKHSGISYKPGKVGPTFGHFDNSGHPGLFVPQLDGHCKLYKNDGTGHFTDVTAQAGDLAKLMGTASCATWGDISNDGRLDLIIGCLRGPNRFFRNLGNGKFEDATESLGLHKHHYNTQAVCLVDLNDDGVLDMVFNNEGQESCMLFRNPRTVAGKQTPVSIQVTGRSGIVGSRVRLSDKNGKLMGLYDISGGDGRGGQQSPYARFTAPPGRYRVEVRSSASVVRAKEITVGTVPLRTTIDFD
jgi:hypothetical protein